MKTSTDQTSFRITIPLFVYGLFFAERDAFGISNFLATFLPGVYALSVVLFIGLYTSAIWLLHCKRLTRQPVLKWNVWAANLLTFLIFASTLLKSFNPLGAISTSLYDGVALVVVWIAAFRDGNGERALIGYIFIQMLLSTLVLLNPGFEFIDGRYYQNLLGRFTIDPSLNEGFVLDKLLVGSYGVFHNPNALGFYSIAGIFCGLLLIGKGRFNTVFPGVLLISFGLYGWINSLTRGPVLALLASLLLVYALDSMKKGAFNVLIKVYLISIVLFAAAFYAYDFFEYIIPSSDSVSVYARFDGYIDGLTAFQSSPILGVDGSTYWDNRVVPHLLPLYFLANHGMIAGMLISALFLLTSAFVLVRSIKLYLRRTGFEDSLRFSISLLLLCIAVALTNNITSPFLFWAAFAQSLITYTRASIRWRRIKYPPAALIRQ